MSYWSAKQYTSFSLLINAAIFVLIGGSLVVFLMVEFGVTLKQAVLGTWKWQEAMKKLHEAFLGTSVFLPRQSWGDNTGSDCFLIQSGRQETQQKKSLGRLSDRHLHQIFTRLDIDHSNTIDVKELFVALHNSGMDVSMRDCEVMMRHADANGKLSACT